MTEWIDTMSTLNMEICTCFHTLQPLTCIKYSRWVNRYTNYLQGTSKVASLYFLCTVRESTTFKTFFFFYNINVFKFIFNTSLNKYTSVYELCCMIDSGKVFNCIYETFSCVRCAKTLSYWGQHLCGRRSAKTEILLNKVGPERKICQKWLYMIL